MIHSAHDLQTGVEMARQISMVEALVSPRLGKNDKLDKIEALIDWSSLIPLLKGLRGAPTGRPPFPPLAMLKAVYLQALYDLSDPGLEEMLGDRLSQVSGVTMIPISALGDKGLDQLMSAVITAYDIWNKRVKTSALNRWLTDAVQRHSPPATSGRRIKLRYVTQASARPPTFIAFCSKPENVPQSYIRYLVNSLRETFKLPGVPIRFHLRKSENPFADT